MNGEVQMKVHWSMRMIAVIGIVVFPLFAVIGWRNGNGYEAILLLVIALSQVWLLLLAATKIEVNKDGISAEVVYGAYVMRWEEVVSVDRKRFTTQFFSKEKAFGYNTLLAGKGKQELEAYVEKTIDAWQWETGRPAGVTAREVRKMTRNAKVRGWKLL